MSKVKLKFKESAGDDLTIDWPVKVKMPESVKPSQRSGRAQGRHVEKTFFLTYKLLPDSEINDLLKELQEHNERIAKAKAAVADAKSDDERDAAEKAAADAEDGFVAWRVALLREVIVGLPDNHGWDALFEELPEFSPALVEAMADYRMIGKAMEEGYWEMANGGK